MTTDAQRKDALERLVAAANRMLREHGQDQSGHYVQIPVAQWNDLVLALVELRTAPERPAQADLPPQVADDSALVQQWQDEVARIEAILNRIPHALEAARQQAADARVERLETLRTILNQHRMTLVSMVALLARADVRTELRGVAGELIQQRPGGRP
jgi:hypothetical protein